MSFYSLDTPFGKMVAKIANEKLIFLQFESSILVKNKCMVFSSYPSKSLNLLRDDLEKYYLNPSYMFKTPVTLQGTLFECAVWRALENIPVGKTVSYSELAIMIQKPSALRATASAVAKNPIAIIQPCHRVIRKNGNIGKYQAGSELKEKLLRHEKWRARKDSNLRPSGS